jgi:hypothetical protein
MEQDCLLLHPHWYEMVSGMWGGEWKRVIGLGNVRSVFSD